MSRYVFAQQMYHHLRVLNFNLERIALGCQRTDPLRLLLDLLLVWQSVHVDNGHDIL